MELKIISDTENLLFKRKEVKAEISAETTPTREKIKELLAEKFSTQKGNIKIKKIEGKFGSKTFKVFANIYQSEKDLADIELKKKKDKSKNVEEQK